MEMTHCKLCDSAGIAPSFWSPSLVVSQISCGLVANGSSGRAADLHDDKTDRLLTAQAVQRIGVRKVDAFRQTVHSTGFSIDPRAQQDGRVDLGGRGVREKPQQAGSDQALQV